jgi:hypothetical protein
MKVVLGAAGALVLVIVVISVASGGGKTTKSTAVKPVSHSQAAKPKPVVLTAAQKAAAAKAAAAQAAAQKAAAAKAAAAQAAAAKAAAAQAAAAQAAAAQAAAAKTASENVPISASQWGIITRDPASHAGEIYTITGTVSQYDINSDTFATVENAALLATDSNGNQFVLEANSSQLGNVASGSTFSAKISVVGAVPSQSVTGGGTGQLPDFDASTFHVTG